MEIKEAINGFIRGTYLTGVGTCCEEKYPLFGAYDKDGQALGWVVSYQAYNSTCAWSGQAFDQEGKTCIHTTWLLTQTTDIGDIWQSTNIGVDVFIPDDGTCDNIHVGGVPRQSNIPKRLLDKQKK